MRSAVTDASLQQTSLPAEFAQNIDFETDVVTIPVRLCNLPPFNAIASQALALTTDSDADLRQFSEVIGGDPAFTADVLFLANSSLFGFPSRMHSLHRGCNRGAPLCNNESPWLTLRRAHSVSWGHRSNPWRARSYAPGTHG